MNLLIDTHVLLWHMTADLRLQKKFIEEIENEGNEVFVSNGSLWEIAIKVSVEKLVLSKSMIEIGEYLVEQSFQVLDFKPNDLEILSKLPFHHRDPFDRLIISQAMNNNFTVITDDNKFKLYPVQLL